MTQFDGAKKDHKRDSRLRHTNPGLITGGISGIFDHL
jgi:hypothetical protein